MLKSRISAAVAEVFRDVLPPFFYVRNFSGSFVNQYLAVVFDPWFKYLKSSLMGIHRGNAGETRCIARIYNENVIIQYMLCNRSQAKAVDAERVSEFSTLESQEPDEIEDCFAAFDSVEEEKSAMNAMKSELRA